MVDNIDKQEYEMIGASDGYVFNLNDNSIEVYKYNITDKGQKAIFEKIEKEGMISPLGIMSSAQTNGSFIIVGYQDHPEKKKILECFHNF
jgi:hypothetical protein